MLSFWAARWSRGGREGGGEAAKLLGLWRGVNQFVQLLHERGSNLQVLRSSEAKTTHFSCINSRFWKDIVRRLELDFNAWES